MGLGGPVWHASAAPLIRGKGRMEDLRRIALRHLAAVGDRAHEWHEWSGYAYHVRRRLTSEEQATVGDVVDLRGTLEGLERFLRVRARLPAACVRLARQELGLRELLV